MDSSDAATPSILREINRVHRLRYRLVEPLRGGVQSGAWLLVGDNGHPAVLKWSPDRSWSGQTARARNSVRRARRAGYPTPRWLAVGVSSEGFGYQVQQFVIGSVRQRMSVAVARRLVTVLELQDGLDPDPGRSWSRYLHDWYRSEWTRTILRVEEVGEGGTELVSVCEEILAFHAYPDLPHRDLVHGDFRLSNILFTGDDLVGVIDIEAIGSGSRVFDYATALDCGDADDEAIALLVEAAVRASEPGVLVYCAAHVFLDLVLFMRDHPSVAASPDHRASDLAHRLRLIATML